MLDLGVLDVLDEAAGRVIDNDAVDAVDTQDVVGGKVVDEALGDSHGAADGRVADEEVVDDVDTQDVVDNEAGTEMMTRTKQKHMKN